MSSQPNPTPERGRRVPIELVLLLLVFGSLMAFALIAAFNRPGNNQDAGNDSIEVKKAVAFVEKLGGTVGRDENAPGKPVVWVNLNLTKVTDVGLKELAALKHLKELYLREAPVSDAGLKELAPLKNLNTLQLTTKTTDQTLQNLRQIGLLHALVQATAEGGKRPLNADQVVKLDLQSTKVSDAGLKELAPLTKLEVLDLRWTKVSDAGLKELAPLKNLNTLALSTKTTDQTLQNLRQIGLLHALWEAKAEGGKRPLSADQAVNLDLSDTEVSDAGLKELAPLTKLQVLDLAYTKVSGAGLKDLAPLKNLNTLVLTTVTDQTLQSLRQIGLLHALNKATAEGWERPLSAEQVVKLDLSRTEVTDAGLKELAPLTKLQVLDLSSTQVSDAGLKELAPLKNLRELWLDWKVDGRGLKELAPLKDLRTLHLSWVTDQALQNLGQIGLLHALDMAKAEKGERPTSPEQVVALSLSSAKVSDTGLKELAKLKNLKSLNLNGTNVTGAGLKELAKLKNLKSLDLYGTKVTGVDLKELAGLDSLHTLHLDDTQLTDAGLKELARFKNLRTLHVARLGASPAQYDKILRSLGQAGLLHLLHEATAEGGTRPLGEEQVVALDLTEIDLITDAGLKELAILKNLHTLKLPKEEYKGPINAAGLKELAPFKKLHTLNLGRLEVTDQVLQNLRQIGLLHALERATAEGKKRPLNAEQVVALNLKGTPITNAGLKELAMLHNLKSLDLSETKITVTGVKELVPLQNLEELNLSKTFVTNLALPELAQLTKLKWLDLSETAVSDADLLALTPLKNLKWLNLHYTKATYYGTSPLRKALPNCKIEPYY